MQFNAMAPIIELPEAEWRLWCVKNWPYQASIQFAIPIGTFTNDSPNTSSVAWSKVIVEYQGNQYVITDGNTSDKYIYWEAATPTVFAHSATIPTITENLIVVGINTAGEYQPSWKAGQAAVVANTVSATAIDGITITGATIQTDAAANTGIKLTTTDFYVYDGTDPTFRLVASTGNIYAGFIYGMDTHTYLGIQDDGVFFFRDLRNSFGVRINQTTTALIEAYHTSGTATSLTISSDGTGSVIISQDGGADTVATFNGTGMDLAVGDCEISTDGKGVIMTNAAGTVTKRVRLNDAGDGLIFEDP